MYRRASGRGSFASGTSRLVIARSSGFLGGVSCSRGFLLRVCEKRSPTVVLLRPSPESAGEVGEVAAPREAVLFTSAGVVGRNAGLPQFVPLLGVDLLSGGPRYQAV